MRYEVRLGCQDAYSTDWMLPPSVMRYSFKELSALIIRVTFGSKLRTLRRVKTVFFFFYREQRFKLSWMYGNWMERCPNIVSLSSALAFAGRELKRPWKVPFLLNKLIRTSGRTFQVKQKKYPLRDWKAKLGLGNRQLHGNQSIKSQNQEMLESWCNGNSLFPWDAFSWSFELFIIQCSPPLYVLVLLLTF